MVQAQRRLEHASSSRRAPAARVAPSTAALFEAMRVAALKWMEHRGEPLRDVCPSCSALVTVTVRDGESDIAHATPVCAVWLFFATGVGGHSPRIVDGGGG